MRAGRRSRSLTSETEAKAGSCTTKDGKSYKAFGRFADEGAWWDAERGGFVFDASFDKAFHDGQIWFFDVKAGTITLDAYYPLTAPNFSEERRSAPAADRAAPGGPPPTNKLT